MYKIVFAFAAAMLLGTAAQAQDCSLKQIASLPITTTASGKIAVPVKIAGRDVLMAVELNAAISGLNANAIDEMKLTTAPIPGAYVPPDLDNIVVTPAASVFIYEDEVFTKGIRTSTVRKVTLPELQIGALSTGPTNMQRCRSQSTRLAARSWCRQRSMAAP